MDPLFGSETRARVLDQLARVPRPQTAYAVARIVEAEPIQVLRILKSLPDVTEQSPRGWVLTDDLLRAFLIARSHRSSEERRAEKDGLLARFGMRPRHAH
ncbi:MAG: hypothetical protein L3J93_01355 [Thermoplasmata archaeon]|nr:hypothetical protein [Thermoplasmata archaeon]